MTKSKIQNKSKIRMSNSKTEVLLFIICTLSLFCYLCFDICHYLVYAQDIKQPNVSGAFYPDNPQELSGLIDSFLTAASPQAQEGAIFALISPHAGYEFSGQTAAYGYKLIQDKKYKTVVIIGPSHYYGFRGVSIYNNGKFRTPLGDVSVDNEFANKLIDSTKNIKFIPEAFQKEHSIEVQIPFLQKTLPNFSAEGGKIVPIVIGQIDFGLCGDLAERLISAIGNRKDVLILASTDMYHGDDYKEAEIIDRFSLSILEEMDAKSLFDKLNAGTVQFCGGNSVVVTMLTAKGLGHHKLKVLKYTNSAEVTGRKIKGIWTVGYTSCVIDGSTTLTINPERSRRVDREKGEGTMLNKSQRKRLLEIARNSIETYLKTNKKLELTETDPILLKEMGAFVTLHEHGELRGCIGNLIGDKPLYLTIRDMAVEAAVGDPRFAPIQISELKDIEIEISALSPLERIDSTEKIQLGVHGVLIKKGFNSGVFLPQVATETNWTKEEFLSYLCAHKAGLAPDAWKDKATEIYIFTAEVFSENNY